MDTTETTKAAEPPAHPEKEMDAFLSAIGRWVWLCKKKAAPSTMGGRPSADLAEAELPDAWAQVEAAAEVLKEAIENGPPPHDGPYEGAVWEDTFDDDGFDVPSYTEPVPF